MRFATHTVITAAALAVVALLLDGIDVEGAGPLRNAATLVGVALVFGLVNATIKPLVRKAGGCAYIITLGLAALVVNGLLFLLTEMIANGLDLPFDIDGFWPALWGAILVGITSWLLGLVVSGRSRH